MAEQSKTSSSLWLLSSLEDFQAHNLKLISNSRRKLQILSDQLDSNLYAQSDFLDELSRLARSSPQVEIQILVKDFKLAIETGHPLIKLAQRISSKIQLKKITQPPQKNEMAYMICDLNGLIFQNDAQVYQGFANYNAAPEIQALRDEFTYLWERAEVEKELQLLHI